jgi:dienelactone hydrolase
MKFSSCVLLGLICGTVAHAAATAKTKGDEMIQNFFKTETAKLSENCLSDIHTLADWNAKKGEYRRELFEMLGLWPLPEKTDLKPVVTGTLDHPEFTVEKLEFQSSPGLYCTADVYVPKNLAKPAPAILYVCGHAKVETNGVSYGNKTAYQHHGEWFARNGYVCLVLDTIELGEIPGHHHGTYREKMWWWNSRGYTPAGVEAWNGIRALDYLQSRSDVDGNRLGITGRSGGGAYSWYIAALDDRIKVAAPIAGITDLQNHIVDGCVEGHCDCMFMVNTYRWDYPQVATLIAPRPLLFGNSDKDKIFPLDGVLRVHAKLKRIYELNDATNNLGLLITDGPHADTQDLQVPVFRWFNRFLKGENSIINIAATNHFSPADLKVFAQLPKDERTSKIHETFVPAAKNFAAPADKAHWKTMRDGWKKFLAEKVFGAWPTNEAPPKMQLLSSAQNKEVRVQQFEFTSQENIVLPIFVAQKRSEKSKRLVVRILGENEAKEFSAISKDVAKQNLASNDVRKLKLDLAEKNSAIAYVLPRGIGPTAWTSDERKFTHIRRRFMLLGTTLDSMRVWDIQRAISALNHNAEFEKLPTEIRAENNMAVNAIYAAIFSPEIATLNLKNVPASHRIGPDYLNVLKQLDVPQALAIAAENTSVRLEVSQPGDWSFATETAQNLKWNSLVVASRPLSSERNH